jgi:hypothetical protein
MDVRAVIFAFFVVLAATSNFGFFVGDIDDPALHDVYQLFAAVVVNLVATATKLIDRTHLGAAHLATSLVADVQLITAALVWFCAVRLHIHRRDNHGVDVRWGAVRQCGLGVSVGS